MGRGLWPLSPLGSEQPWYLPYWGTLSMAPGSLGDCTPFLLNCRASLSIWNCPIALQFFPFRDSGIEKLTSQGVKHPAAWNLEAGSALPGIQKQPQGALLAVP